MSFGNKGFIVFLERAKEILKIEYKIFFKEQFYLNEFEKITWCNNTEQKYGTVSDLIIANYEKLFKNAFLLKSN